MGQRFASRPQGNPTCCRRGDEFKEQFGVFTVLAMVDDATDRPVLCVDQCVARCDGSGHLCAVQSAFRRAPIVKPSDNFLAGIAPFAEADCPVKVVIKILW